MLQSAVFVFGFSTFDWQLVLWGSGAIVHPKFFSVGKLSEIFFRVRKFLGRSAKFGIWEKNWNAQWCTSDFLLLEICSCLLEFCHWKCAVSVRKLWFPVPFFKTHDASNANIWLIIMQAAQSELLSCQTQLDQLSTECMEVCPIYARQAQTTTTNTSTTTPPCAVLALWDYSNKEVTTTTRTNATTDTTTKFFAVRCIQI